MFNVWGHFETKNLFFYESLNGFVHYNLGNGVAE